MFDDEDFEDYFEEEQDRKAAIEKYESMLKDHDSVYFDSEEFEYIIDHYTEQNELKKSRQAVEIAMTQHPDSNLLKIKEARQYLLENDAQRAFDLLQHVDLDEEEPDYSDVLDGEDYEKIDKTVGDSFGDLTENEDWDDDWDEDWETGGVWDYNGIGVTEVDP